MGQRGPGLWDEVCSPKMQWWSLLALPDLYVINRPHTINELPSKIENAHFVAANLGRGGDSPPPAQRPAPTARSRGGRDTLGTRTAPGCAGMRCACGHR